MNNGITLAKKSKMLKLFQIFKIVTVLDIWTHYKIFNFIVNNGLLK